MDVFDEIAKVLKENDDYFVVVDDDLDGISSGILTSVILRKLGKDFEIRIRTGKIKDLGRKGLENVLKTKRNVILTIDIPYSDEDMINLVSKISKKFIYIDHHKREIPKGVPSNLFYFDVRARGIVISNAGVIYRVGKRLFGDEFKKYSLIAVVGAIGDYMLENDAELIKDFKDFYGNSLFSPLVFYTYNYILFSGEKILKEDFIEDPSKLFDNSILKEMRKNFSKYSKDMSAKPEYSSKNLLIFRSRYPSLVSTVISSILRDKIVLVYYHKDFWRRKIKISLRFQNAEKYGIDLGKLAQKFCKTHGIRGGGHPQAAGLLIWKKNFKDLVEFIEKELEQR